MAIDFSLEDDDITVKGESGERPSPQSTGRRFAETAFLGVMLEMIRSALLSMLVLFPASFCWAESRTFDVLRSSGIIENHVVRTDLIGELTKPLSDIRTHEDIWSFPGDDQTVLVKTILQPNAVYFIFINETDQGYPEAAKGNYLIKRSRSSGRFESIKIFYRDEDFCYIEITRRKHQSQMNVYLFKKKIHHEVPLAIPLDELVTAPLARVIEASLGFVDWETLLFHGGREEDRRVRSILEAVNRELPRVRTAADGALDSTGRYVAIDDGRPLAPPAGFNCSGFLKWLVDGFYQPLTGRYLAVEKLKTKHLDRRGNRWSQRLESDKDPYFGLDWTRNLALAAAEAQTGIPGADSESQDVRHVPLFEYQEDSGYRVSDLRLILFYLAVAESGTIYLGAVNDIYGPRPVLVEYFHVAALLPYFDDEGVFRVAVLDQHKNQSLDDFASLYASYSIHLSRLRTGTDFSLFHIE